MFEHWFSLRQPLRVVRGNHGSTGEFETWLSYRAPLEVFVQTTIEGAATFTGTSSLTVSSEVTHTGIGSAQGSSSFSVSPELTQHGAISEDGTSSLALEGSITFHADADFDGTASVTADGVVPPPSPNAGAYDFWITNRIPITHIEGYPHHFFTPVPNVDIPPNTDYTAVINAAAVFTGTSSLAAEAQDVLNPRNAGEMEHWWTVRIPITYVWNNRRFWTLSSETFIPAVGPGLREADAEFTADSTFTADAVVEYAAASTFDGESSFEADLIEVQEFLGEAVFNGTSSFTNVTFEASAQFNGTSLITADLVSVAVTASAVVYSDSTFTADFTVIRTYIPTIDFPGRGPILERRNPRNLNPSYAPCDEMGVPRVTFFERITGAPRGTYIIDSYSVNYVIDEVSTFSFTIAAGQSVHGLELDNHLRARLAIGENRHADGSVDTIGFEDGLYSIECSGFLWQLTRCRAKSNARYDNQPVLGILYDLLEYDTNWTVGNISTMRDFLVRVSIDLRDEKRLFAQIKRLIEAVPEVHIRHEVLVDEEVAVGYFDEHIYPPLSSVDLLAPITRKTTYAEILKRIEAYGGEYEVTIPGVGDEDDTILKKTITLRDAFLHTPELQDHPEFPIGRSNGPWCVSNAAIHNLIGESVVERYTEIVPSTRRDPTSNQIQQAGYALWQRAVADLKLHTVIEDEWSISTQHIPCELIAGDRVYVQGFYQQVYYDYITGEQRSVEMGAVQGWFRVIEYTESYSDGTISYDLKVTPNESLPSAQRQALRLFDSIAKRIREEGSTADNEDELELPEYDILSMNLGPGLQSDNFNGVPGQFYPARSGAMDSPDDADPGSVELLRLFSTFDGAYDIRQTDPVLADGIVRFSASVSENWTTEDELPVYALIRYTKI